MLPIFPNFRQITAGDRKVILSYTNGYKPYSDYNFYSLYSWDTNGETALSDLNGNLVIQMPDYLTGEKIITFIGKKEIDETVKILLQYAKEHAVSKSLTLIPEEVALEIKSKDLHVVEEEGDFDYVFSTKLMKELAGRSFKSKRHLAKRFITDNPNVEFRTVSLSESNSHKEILEVVNEWILNQEDQLEAIQEKTAIERILSLSANDSCSLIFSGVYLNKELIAFSIDEVLDGEYALSHFYKARKGYRGVSEYLNMNIANYLSTQNVNLWNWEQDLGIKGLRESKQSYRPVTFLKKYRIEKIA